MVANIIRWLRYEEYYSPRAIALIVGCSYDTVLKTLRGEVYPKVLPSFEGLTDEMLERKYTVDKLYNLELVYEIQDIEQLGYYATLLRYLGYSKEHLRILFQNMSSGWVHSRYFAKDEWKKFNYALLGIEQEQWKDVFKNVIKFEG